MIIVFAIGAIIGSVSAGFNGLDLLYKSKSYDLPNKIVYEQTSPNGEYKALILFDERTNNYYFAIQGRDKVQLILSNKFVPSRAYHDPIFKLHWRNSESIEITLDYDFGENNKVFEFNTKELFFSEK